MIHPSEHLDRIERLQKKLSVEGIDAYLVSSEENIYYLTGIPYRPLERPFFIVVQASGAVLIVPALEAIHLKEAAGIEKVVSYWDFPAPKGETYLDCLLDALSHVNTLGVEPNLSSQIYIELSALTLKHIALVEQIRSIKSEAEIGMLRQSSRYADFGMQKILEAAYFGVSELELFAQTKKVQLAIMSETEYDVLTTDLLIGAWPAPLSAQPHGVPTIHDRLYEGPHIGLSFLRVNGYSAECERTFFLRPPSIDLKDAFAAMNEARRRAFELMRPGVHCHEIDLVTSNFLHDEGYGAFLLHRTGHGFGLSNHEEPWIAKGSGDILRKNMLVSNEPGIYIPSVGGVRHSDTILITDTGHESLTKYSTDIESLTITAFKPVRRMGGAVMRRMVSNGKIAASQSTRQDIFSVS
jgi:Xaa-Pro dipeptidase